MHSTDCFTDDIRDLRIFEIRFEFESDASDSIPGWFKIFESAAPAVIPQTILTVQQKLQPLRRCNWDLFMILAKRDYVTFD